MNIAVSEEMIYDLNKARKYAESKLYQTSAKQALYIYILYM